MKLHVLEIKKVSLILRSTTKHSFVERSSMMLKKTKNIDLRVDDA